MAVIEVKKFEFVPETKRQLTCAVVNAQTYLDVIAIAHRRNAHFTDLAQSAKAKGDNAEALRLIQESCQSAYLGHVANYLELTGQTGNFLDYLCGTAAPLLGDSRDEFTKFPDE